MRWIVDQDIDGSTPAILSAGIAASDYTPNFDADSSFGEPPGPSESEFGAPVSYFIDVVS